MASSPQKNDYFQIDIVFGKEVSFPCLRLICEFNTYHAYELDPPFIRLYLLNLYIVYFSEMCLLNLKKQM